MMTDIHRAQILMPLVAFASSGMPVAHPALVVPGPELVVLLGVTIPIVSALFGSVGVVAGQLLAPPATTSLSLRRRIALAIVLQGLLIGIVIATGQQPLVAMAWGVGLGFSGLGVAETLGGQAKAGIVAISEAFFAAAAARIGGAQPKETKDDAGA